MQAQQMNVRSPYDGFISENLNPENVACELKGVHGILVAPGFGDRGIEGKIKAVQYAREQNIPMFGICLGMQMAVIEFSRNVLGFEELIQQKWILTLLTQ